MMLVFAMTVGLWNSVAYAQQVRVYQCEATCLDLEAGRILGSVSGHSREGREEAWERLLEGCAERVDQTRGWRSAYGFVLARNVSVDRMREFQNEATESNDSTENIEYRHLPGWELRGGRWIRARVRVPTESTATSSSRRSYRMVSSGGDRWVFDVAEPDRRSCRRVMRSLRRMIEEEEEREAYNGPGVVVF